MRTIGLPQQGQSQLASVRAFDAVSDHILHMADTLSDGIIKQFPAKFAGVAHPQADHASLERSKLVRVERDVSDQSDLFITVRRVPVQTDGPL